MSAQPWLEVGYRIYQRRREAGLSLRALSLQCGVPRSTLSRLERGATNVHAEAVSAVADALDMTLVDLFGGPRPRAECD